MRVALSMSRTVCWMIDEPGESERRSKKYGFRELIYVYLENMLLTSFQS